ncbi:hypothetical protein [Halovivax sp.]|uniref:hypothetical protein n=1 Tax=Halovivax sp. TaxID=1935978 RepID=UPI0025BCB56B|nr:hypothetical protein [Halovivax sp.]
MTALAEPSEPVRRAIFVSIVIYFALFGVAAVTGNPAAYLTAQVLFGAIAVGIGATLYAYTDPDQLVLRTGAGCFVMGGLAQFGWLAAQFGVLEAWGPGFWTASSVLVFVGIGCYVYAAWVRS